MGWYAGASAKRTRQIFGDVFVAGWTLLWILVGRGVAAAVGAVAGPSRALADNARQVESGFHQAAEQAARVPALGETLRQPFDQTAGSIGGLVGAAEQQVTAIETLAVVLGVVTFAIPFLIVLALWLPGRIRFVRSASAVRRLLDSGAGADLFALRALASEPVTSLVRISPDPVQAWRDDDRQVIDQLAAIELGRYGLRPPGAEPRGR